MKIPKTHPHWVFDNSPIDDPHGRGERASAFFKALRHPKSAARNKSAALPRFWDRIVRRIYGPSDADGNRLTRTVYIQIPRGARKTTIGAGLGLLHSFGPERRPGETSLLAAGAEDQAQLAFDEALSYIRATKPFNRLARIVESELTLERKDCASILRAIPADGDKQHGKTPYFVLIDELHIWQNRRLWRALKTGLIKIPNTLLVIITTAGRGHDTLAHEEYEYAKGVATGRIVDPSYLPIIFEPPEGYDWRDEDVWRLVNPGLSEGFPDIVGMRQLVAEATHKPADLEDFKNYNLNQWLDHSESPFCDMGLYDEGSKPIDLAALKGQPCWLGVDLSSTEDLTAIVAAWRDGADGYIIHPWFFCPGDTLRRRTEKDSVPYSTWAKAGFITATPGPVVDYAFVQDRVEQLCRDYRVQEIAFDRRMAVQMISSLLQKGLPAVEFPQSWAVMVPAIKELERAIIGRNLQHGAHPILRWNFSNIVVATNNNGDRMFSRTKSRDKIDGAVAAAMAVGRAFHAPKHNSPFRKDFNPADYVL
jgi:phage terminase large subunit-like protein